ncbi:MAG: hypothetical protein R3244_10855 [Thermoanaerobaculia bacterium]|nr:hypothetical protein [Thermoanaerobaculia bacterium]
MQARRAALAFLSVASPGVVLAFWLGGGPGELLFALVAAVFPIALVVLAVGERGAGRLVGPLLVLSLILLGSLVAIWLLRGRLDELPWIGGLPLAAAIQLYGLWFVPLLLVALAYALNFDTAGLSDVALERLHRRTESVESGSRDSRPSEGTPVEDVRAASDPPRPER